MKCFFLLVSSLVLAFCSGPSEVTDSNNESKLSSENDKNSSFNRLPPDMIRNIATFMEPKEIANWRTVNGLTRFSIPLKKAVELIFNIPGLDGINDFEPELAGVMRLAQISHDPMLFFTALMEDVVEGKKPYVVLFSPLVLHLLRTFRELGAREKKDYRRNFEERFYVDVEKFMTKICALKGHFDLVFEIAGDNALLASWALCDAAQLGHTRFVELLLQNRTYICASDAGSALGNAARNGNIAIVELLLQHQTDTSVDHVGWALKYAAYFGHATIVELLLKSRNDISADDVGWALCRASKNGHIAIVELLQSRNDVSTYHVGWAFRNAAQGGHTYIVELLSQYQLKMNR